MYEFIQNVEISFYVVYHFIYLYYLTFKFQLPLNHERPHVSEVTVNYEFHVLCFKMLITM